MNNHLQLQQMVSWPNVSTREGVAGRCSASLLPSQVQFSLCLFLSFCLSDAPTAANHHIMQCGMNRLLLIFRFEADRADWPLIASRNQLEKPSVLISSFEMFYLKSH